MEKNKKNISHKRKIYEEKYKRKHSSFQIGKKLPILLLFVICLVAISFFGKRYLNMQEDSKEQNRDVLTVICPELSGAADAFLLCNDGEAILIDSGLKEDGEGLVSLLQEQNIDSLKALILTHYDKDHIGGATEILENFSVEKCYMTCGSEDSEEYTALMDALEKNGAEQIMMTETGSFSALNGEFTIYPPLQSEYESNTDNNLSLITKISFMGQNLLFAGDAQKERCDEYLENQYDGTKFDLLKVPHHGRSGKTIKALLNTFTPGYALVSSSTDEPADDDVLDALKEAGVDTYDTVDGTVIFKVNQYGITVKQ